MKYLACIALAILTTGCLQTLGITRGPGSVTYEINVDQHVEGQPLHAEAEVPNTFRTSGGVVINIAPIGDDSIQTEDDRSQAKEAAADTTPTVKVTP